MPISRLVRGTEGASGSNRRAGRRGEEPREGTGRRLPAAGDAPLCRAVSPAEWRVVGESPGHLLWRHAVCVRP